MKYMLLIIGDESRYSEMSEEEGAAQMALWDAYTKELVAAGALVSGEGLQTSTTATTLRVENDEPVLTDGPFAETKEQVGGFYVIDVENLDQAIEWAKKLPSTRNGGVTEIRPVMDDEAAGLEDPQREGAAS
jgi:hypothetical protein